MNIMVTGGAGYIGSILSNELINKDYKVIIVDNLRNGHKEAIPRAADFVFADIRDSNALSEVFQRFEIEAVMHLAAETSVELSMTNPKVFFEINVACGMNLLNTMLKHSVLKLIFSSSAAVYGIPGIMPIDEDSPKVPVNSYGESKLMFERILHWYERAYGFKWISLRYFNAAGANENFGEDHRPETHLIPNILKSALKAKHSIALFGTDYPTNDGTCIRDYVHVLDISQAHILALEKIDKLSGRIYNLGNGTGYSVREIVKVAKEVTGIDIREEIGPRRAGDPPILIASSERAKRELGWIPEFYNLETIIGSAWSWLKSHPHGYQDALTSETLI
jgi:UDP-glucose 4-epimerase